MESEVRKLLTGFKVTADCKMATPAGPADWADSWQDDYGFTARIDACLLGGEMYPGYEQYWTGIQNEPDKPAWVTGAPPTAGELGWARFAAETTHYVLSKTLTSANWPKTQFLRSIEDVAALKKQPGKDIYLMGGGRVTASLIDAGLVDELQLIVHPLLAGEGTPLFATLEQRHRLELQATENVGGGRIRLSYVIP
jgi:dihydrofolate reductase